jgi:predicted nucleic-acid-binding Zn-ribbon protein
MTTKVSPLKRAVKAAKQAMGPQRYGAKGKPFACPLCGCDQYHNGDYIALFGMYTLVCDSCGHVEFFKRKPELVAS